MATGPARRTVVVVVAGSGTADELRRLLDPDAVDVLAAGEEPEPGAPDVVVADAAHLAEVGQQHPGVPVLALVPPSPPDGEAARLAAAEGRVAELEAWAARASHDLATPLAVISMMAETMHASWDRLDVRDRERLLGSIQNQATKAREMLDEAIALARGERGSSPPRP